MKQQQHQIQLEEQISLHQQKSKAIYSKIENCIDQMLLLYEQAEQNLRNDESQYQSTLLQLNRQLLQLKPIKTVKQYFRHYYHKLSNLLRNVRNSSSCPLNLSNVKSSRRLSSEPNFNNISEQSGRKLSSEANFNGRIDYNNQEKLFNSFLNSFISKPEQYQALDRLIVEHFLRQGDLPCVETWDKIEEEVDPKRIFRECLAFKQDICRCQTEQAIKWCENSKILQTYQTLLQFELRKLNVMLLVQREQFAEALEYLKVSMNKFHTKCHQQISQLITYILFKSSSHWQSLLQDIEGQSFAKAVKERYALFEFTQDKCEALADYFVLQYLKINGISKFDSLQVIYECFTKVNKQYLRLASVMWKDNINKLGNLEKQQQIVLPFSVKLEKDHQYHSVFLCPVTKEVHSSTEVSVLLACGHLISENANARIIQENRNKRKFKCPICQKEIRVEDSINAKF